MDRRYTRAHKQRKGRHRRVEVLNTAELQQRLDVSGDDLERELRRLQLGYHKDARGEIWVSMPADFQPTLPLSAPDE